MNGLNEIRLNSSVRYGINGIHIRLRTGGKLMKEKILYAMDCVAVVAGSILISGLYAWILMKAGVLQWAFQHVNAMTLWIYMLCFL